MTRRRTVWKSRLAVAAALSLGGASLWAQEGPASAEPMPTLSDEALSEPAPALADDAALSEPSTPAPTDEAAPDATASAPAEPNTIDPAPEPSGPETIQERFPNGAIKIERQVIQDSTGNYVNHGPWKQFDQRGNVIASGEYVHGERHGVWNRWYRSGEAELLSKAPYNDFPGPFISQATFKNGKLHGAWTIYDARQRKISQFETADGLRQGNSTWWYSNGKPMRAIEYRDGMIDGSLREWSPDGRLTTNQVYQMGRKLALKTQMHSGGQKKSEGMYLFAALNLEKPDEWWDARLATYTQTGKDERHGAWTAWYVNGQKQQQGEYRNDAPLGKFTWWHENGQKGVEGEYVEGKQHGRWTWWHNNGQKSIQGQYAKGDPAGRWTWWKEDGKLSQTLEMSHGEGVATQLPSLPSTPERAPAKSASPGRLQPRR